MGKWLEVGECTKDNQAGSWSAVINGVSRRVVVSVNASEPLYLLLVGLNAVRTSLGLPKA